jgi:multimeric flavodoxin WrbA
MNILVINGTSRHGSTWHIKQLLVNELSKNREANIKEVTLPTDLPEYCVGCFQCIVNGEHLCPHAVKVSAIERDMIEADCIIMTSPVYCMDVSGPLKNLLDHFGYRWMSHRPHPSMFSKIAVTLTTAAGAGTKHTTKTMRSSLEFWGIARIYSLKFNVAAMNYHEISKDKKIQILRAVDLTTSKVLSHLDKGKVKPSLKTRLLFSVMRMMQRGNDWNMTDYNHWKQRGWLKKVRPY